MYIALFAEERQIAGRIHGNAHLKGHKDHSARECQAVHLQGKILSTLAVLNQ
jgi:hypothetical protein